MSTKFQILLVEDDPVWRTMLPRFLNNEPDLLVVQSVDSKEDAISFCYNHKVDVVLMDICLTENNLDGIQATLELSLMGIGVKVIALTSLDNERIKLDTYKVGAIQYVNKSDFRNIPDTIRRVLNTTSPQEIMVREDIRIKEAEQYNILTTAEKEIVALSEKGNERAQIIEKPGKSEGTLKNQITNIIRKFNVRSLKKVIQQTKSRGMGNKERDR